MEKILRGEGIKNKNDLRDSYTWENAKEDIEENNEDGNLKGKESTDYEFSKDPEKEHLEKIRQYIENYDKTGKALTGRTPERIEEEDGVKREWAFPEGAKILYVGDPWQRMGKEIDNENMTIIDYEYGDVASFIADDEYFRYIADGKAEAMLRELEFLQRSYAFNEEEKEWVLKLRTMIEDVDFIQQNTETSGNDGYEKNYAILADKWKEIKEFVSSAHKEDLSDEINEEESEKGKGEVGDPQCYKEEDEFSRFGRDSWYAAVFCERGFRDVPDWNNIILPELENLVSEEEKKGEKLTDEEKENIFKKNTKRLIEEIRLKKETKHSNVVEASFPELPFKSESFDRFVASWSISAHIFDVSNKEDFDLYWREISRVLKKNGEAYIFPMDFHFDDKEYMLESLAEQNNFEYKLLDAYGNEVDDPYDSHTLVLKKKI
jgi:hypothetical protein